MTRLERKPPPHSAEAEAAVLGAMLLDADAIGRALETGLREQDLYHAHHRAIFAAALRLQDQRQAVDPLTVREDLLRQGSLERAGGDEYLAEIVSAVPTTANAEYHARIVLEHSRRRRLIASLRRAEGLAWRNGRPAAQLAREAVERLQRLAVEGESTGDGAVLVELSRIIPREVEWLRPQRWARGKLNLLVGDPGLGKSFLTLDAVARISVGREWPEGGQAPRGGAILLSAEDDPADTLVPRLRRLGADLTHIVALTAIREASRERPFSLASDLERLRTAIDRHHPLVAVIDPVSAYLGGTDSHTDADVRGVLAPLSKLASDSNVTVVSVAHLNKAVQMRALYRVGGSVAFTAAARSVFAVVPEGDSDTRRLFVPLKMNLAPKPAALAFTLDARGLTWDENPVPPLDIEAAIRGPVEGDTREVRNAVEEGVEFLEEALRDGPRPATEVGAAAKAVKIGERTLERAKARLGVRSRKTGMDGGWEWHLPYELDQDAPKSANASPHLADLAAFDEGERGNQDAPTPLPKDAKGASEGGTMAAFDASQPWVEEL